MASLWDIDMAIYSCCIDMETGEVINEELLDQLTMERDRKIENIAKWILNLDADALAYKSQKEVFAQKQKAAESKRDSLKKYLAAYLEGSAYEASDKSVKCSFRRSESVEITDLDAIGREFKVEKVEVLADKKAIKEAIKAGFEVPGAELVVNNNLQIK